MSDKTSVTGLMGQQHEVHRLENLFYKKKDSAYFLPDFGLEWDYFLSPKIEVSTSSFLSYMTQQATQNGIIITNINQNMAEFTLNLDVTLLSEETLYLTGSTV